MEQEPAFVFVVSAPYAVPLVGVQGERQAGLPYRAAGAYRLGPLDFFDGPAGLPDREEELGVKEAAGG